MDIVSVLDHFPNISNGSETSVVIHNGEVLAFVWPFEATGGFYVTPIDDEGLAIEPGKYFGEDQRSKMGGWLLDYAPNEIVRVDNFPALFENAYKTATLEIQQIMNMNIIMSSAGDVYGYYRETTRGCEITTYSRPNHPFTVADQQAVWEWADMLTAHKLFQDVDYTRLEVMLNDLLFRVDPEVWEKFQRNELKTHLRGFGKRIA